MWSVLFSDRLVDKILKNLDNKNLTLIAIIDHKIYDELKEKIFDNRELRIRVKNYLKARYRFSYEEGEYQENSQMLKSCKYLVNVKIPDYISRIGYNCFTECKYLERIIFPKYFYCLDSWSFSHCPKIKEIILPKRTIFLGDNVFWKSSEFKIILHS
jgi:hypothetical protein